MNSFTPNMATVTIFSRIDRAVTLTFPLPLWCGDNYVVPVEKEWTQAKNCHVYSINTSPEMTNMSGRKNLLPTLFKSYSY